ncbi:Citrate transporter-like domain-containing protein [Pleurotus pulmonarius]
MITGRSVATLVIFIISIIFVIRPVSFHVQLPYLGRRRVGLGLATAPIIAIAILWAAQCLGPAQIRNGIAGVDGVKPYNILILFFSLAYMAITLDITGILQSAAFWVSNKGGSNGYKLYLYFYLMLTVLSIFLGNDPIILSGTAFLVYYTKVAELDPVSWLMSEFAAANTASMVLFVGNPTNVVICEGFRVNNVAFTAYTILPFLGCSLFCFVALAIQFRSKKYIPRNLPITGDLDVRSVLLDPKGALVGSILLASCLIVIIIVSFFHVDVWMITLPFAVAKFIFDISWDHYRYIKGIPMLGMASPKRKRSVDSGTDTIPVPDIPSDQTTIRQLSKHFSHANDTHTPTRLSTMGTSLTMIDESAHGASDTMVLPTRTESPTLAEHVPIQAPGLTHRTSTPNELPPPGTSNDPRDDKKKSKLYSLSHHFPTFFTALPRLPFKLVPFAFSQFILIEALTHQGWIELFSDWLVRATNRQMHPVIWLIGVLGVVLCNISGTNIGATILLTKVIRAAQLPPASDRAGAIALAVASNIGAVSFTFSASLAGLLWQTILKQKGIKITQTTFAKWNALPLLMMTCVGLAVVSAEMAVIT